MNGRYSLYFVTYKWRYNPSEEWNYENILLEDKHPIEFLRDIKSKGFGDEENVVTFYKEVHPNDLSVEDLAEIKANGGEIG